MAIDDRTEPTGEHEALDAMLREHERRLDDVLDHVIGVLVGIRAERDARAPETGEPQP